MMMNIVRPATDTHPKVCRPLNGSDGRAYRSTPIVYPDAYVSSVSPSSPLNIFVAMALELPPNHQVRATNNKPTTLSRK